MGRHFSPIISYTPAGYYWTFTKRDSGNEEMKEAKTVHVHEIFCKNKKKKKWDNKSRHDTDKTEHIKC